MPKSIFWRVLFWLLVVVIVVFALRNYLLRGITFGAIRQ